VTEMAGQIARRPADVIARFDGGVLAVLLPSTMEASARILATQIDSAVRGRALAHRGSPVGVVTVSIGVAAMSGDVSPLGIVSGAQKSLRLAKSHGRDTRRRADAMSVRTS
jgi:diguanylate cyclase (GGDEF)-like protein